MWNVSLVESCGNNSFQTCQFLEIHWIHFGPNYFSFQIDPKNKFCMLCVGFTLFNAAFLGISEMFCDPDEKTNGKETDATRQGTTTFPAIKTGRITCCSDYRNPTKQTGTRENNAATAKCRSSTGRSRFPPVKRFREQRQRKGTPKHVAQKQFKMPHPVFTSQAPSKTLLEEAPNLTRGKHQYVHRRCPLSLNSIEPEVALIENLSKARGTRALSFAPLVALRRSQIMMFRGRFLPSAKWEVVATRKWRFLSVLFFVWK